MRVIIAGSRTITDLEVLKAAVKAAYLQWGEDSFIHEVVCGEARGADQLGKQWALSKGLRVASFHAMWKEEGRAAGINRNIIMAKNADALIALWDGESRGTKHMIEEATKRGLKVYVHRVTEDHP